jgi:hypothetical protein
VIQGHILAPDHRRLDWSRVDAQGNYSVALPGVGKYLMMANAAVADSVSWYWAFWVAGVLSSYIVDTGSR